MILFLMRQPQPADIKPTDSGKDVDLGKLQLEEQAALNKGSVFKELGWLDRFFAIWILLAMILGILLGNFVEETGSAL